MLPINAITNQPYKGNNSDILQAAAQIYGDARFLTFRQAKESGLMVRKGEKAFRIIRVIEQEGQTKVKRYYVFNIRQCERLEAPYTL